MSCIGLQRESNYVSRISLHYVQCFRSPNIPQIEVIFSYLFE